MTVFCSSYNCKANFMREKDVVLHYICIDFRHVFDCGIKYAWDATLSNPVPQVLLECSQVLCSLALLDLREKSE